MANNAGIKNKSEAPDCPLALKLTCFSTIAVILTTGVIFLPQSPFIIDGGIYYDMGRAMAEQGALAIGDNGGIDEAPPLVKYLTQAHKGLVFPQYPSGYAFIAGPFYLLFGIRGLVLMNALSAAVAFWLTFSISKTLFDGKLAIWSAIILTVFTFIPTYTFAIWPHMLTLAIWLSAVRLALYADEAASTYQRYRLIALSGLLIGAGINIRYDMTLAAVSLFFWLRIFARPRDRKTAILLLVGIIPGLMLSAYLNMVKFGVPSPISYGTKDGADSLDRYFGLMTAGAALLLATAVLNIPRAVTVINNAVGRRIPSNQNNIYAFAICLAGLIALATPFVRDYLYGLYVLIINLQAHNAYHQSGVGPNEYGQILFWGYPKKAFIQSLPFLPVLLAPVVFFVRGRHTREFSLCFLSIGAVISFYALNQWHGGTGYSLRYFLPTLPFIAILCAWTLIRILETPVAANRQFILIAMMAASGAYIIAQYIGAAAPRLYVPASLYPQWGMALALFICISLTLFLPHRRFIARMAFGLAIFAATYAAAINATEFITHEKVRAAKRALSEDIARAIPEGALVITPYPVLLMLAEYQGVAVTVVSLTDVTTSIESAKAFAENGRCVYIHGRSARDYSSQHFQYSIAETPYRAPTSRKVDTTKLEFFPLTFQREACNLNRPGK